MTKNSYFDTYKVCSCCKKTFSMYQYNTKDYVYKTREKTVIHWFCSYPCYRKGVQDERNCICSNRRRSKKYNTV